MTRRITYAGAQRSAEPPAEITVEQLRALLRGRKRPPKPPTTTTPRASYASLSADGWSFAEGPQGCYAWRVVGGRVEQTARYAAGGDHLGARYKHVIAAIARGEHSTLEHDDHEHKQ